MNSIRMNDAMCGYPIDRNGALVVLGAGNGLIDGPSQHTRHNGQMAKRLIAAGAVREAIIFSSGGPDPDLIGKYPMSEAQAMYNEVFGDGSLDSSTYRPKRVLMDDKSFTTITNAENVAEILREEEITKLSVLAQEGHGERFAAIAKNVMPDITIDWLIHSRSATKAELVRETIQTRLYKHFTRDVDVSDQESVQKGHDRYVSFVSGTKKLVVGLGLSSRYGDTSGAQSNADSS